MASALASEALRVSVVSEPLPGQALGAVDWAILPLYIVPGLGKAMWVSLG